MQDALFPDDEPPERPQAKPGRPASKKPVAKAKAGGPKVNPLAPVPAHLELAAALPELARLGTSSWTYPGWNGLVWTVITRTASSQNMAGSLRPAPAVSHRQPGPGFLPALDGRAVRRLCGPGERRFPVCHQGAGFGHGCDGAHRDRPRHAGQSGVPEPELAVQEFALPALQGLGPKLGAWCSRSALCPPPCTRACLSCCNGWQPCCRPCRLLRTMLLMR